MALCRLLRVSVPLAAVLMIFKPVAVSAQATGTISGIVTDSTGAVLPNVSLDITNRATGVVRRAISSGDGVYVVPLLPPGVYTVTATLEGFSTSLRDEVQVYVSETARVDVTLFVGPITGEITVTQRVTFLETANATLGILIPERTIIDLPLNGRNFAQLGILVPGVVAAPAFVGGAAGDATPVGLGNPTGSFNVNGMPNTSNNFLLDGATNNDTLTSGFVLRPPPDAIQEFKILTHSYEAQYGRNAGSVVDVVTKSGTNSWHGAAWEFNRDDVLQARNFFADRNQPKPRLEQHQFGVTLGAPVIRNALFAFGYYEGYRRRSGRTTVLVVPSAAQRAGNFAGGPPIRDPQTGLPFPGNFIPQDRLDPIALRLLNEFVPLPNTGANRHTMSPVVRDDRNQAGLRLDYHPTSKQSVLGRYLWSQTHQLTPPTVQPSAQLARATLQDAMFSHTYIASTNVLNVFRVSSNRVHANPATTSGRRNAEFGINLPNADPRAVGLATLEISGFLDLSNALGDPFRVFLNRVNQVFEFANDTTWLRGRHSLKFGVNIRRDRITEIIAPRPNGHFTFSGGTTGSGAADFLLGLPSQLIFATGQPVQDGHAWTFATYAQDQFRLNARLTLDLGVRYELPIPFVDSGDALAGIDMRRQSLRYPDAPRGLVYPGDPGVPRGIVPTDTNNIAPRLALAWDPSGAGRTSVRAAWGTFYDTIPGQADFHVSGTVTPPFVSLIQLLSPTRITLADPLAALPSAANPFPPGLTVIGWGRDFESPYAYHYNLGMQHQLGDRVGVEVGYVGTRGKHLPVYIDINPGLYEPGQTTRGPRTFPAYSVVRPTFSAAQSWYNALQTSMRTRPVRGFSSLVAYTWSHAVDHRSAVNLGTESRTMLPAIQGDAASVEAALALEKGDAVFDVRHRFVLSFGYVGPRLATQGRMASAILGGWELHGIVQAQTGFPLDVTEGTNLDIRYLTARPDVTCDPNFGPKTTAEWFDTSCFTRRTLAETGQRPGNLGRNVVRGPGFSRTDLALLKNVDFSSGRRIQLRLEAFNVFNQTRFDQPGSTVGTTRFGQITATADDNRIVQLGVKFSF